MLSGVLRSKVAVQANISIMRAFVAMRNYLASQEKITVEISKINAKLALLERADEDNIEAINDLSEDIRKEMENFDMALAALSVKIPEARKPVRPIGFKKQEKK